MKLALFVAAALVRWTATPVAVDGEAIVRAVLLDHESKPVANAVVTVWVHTAGVDPTGTWRTIGDGQPVVGSRVEIGHVRPGECVLVAQYEGPSAQNLIVHRFSVAAGETKDLGSLRPQGKEHSFRLSILDRQGADITSTAAPVPADPERSPIVRFDMVSQMAAAGPPIAWSFYRPRGAVITVRGLDALHSTIELQARTDESTLLPEDLRVVSALRPIVQIGGDRPDPVHLELVVAPARRVRVEFELPKNVRVLDPSQEVEGAQESGTFLTSTDELPVRLAAIDPSGNVRCWRVQTGSLPPSPVMLSLVPGEHHFYALLSPEALLRASDLQGTARQTVSIPDGQGESHLRITFKRGVVVRGRAVMPPEYQDEQWRRSALALDFAALVPPRSLMPLGEFETATIDVPLGPDGSFVLQSLPPGESFVMGLPGAGPKHAKTFRVPSKEGSVGDIVIE